MLGVEQIGVWQSSAAVSGQEREGRGAWEEGIPWGGGDWRDGPECWPLRRTPQGYLGLWLTTGAASSVTTGTGSLSEFYYHSNEDVERYFI